MTYPWLFILCFRIELEFKNVGFYGGKKTGGPGEEPFEQGRELQQTHDAGNQIRTRATLPLLLLSADVM